MHSHIVGFIKSRLRSGQTQNVRIKIKTNISDDKTIHNSLNSFSVTGTCILGHSKSSFGYLVKQCGFPRPVISSNNRDVMFYES